MFFVCSLGLLLCPKLLLLLVVTYDFTWPSERAELWAKSTYINISRPKYIIFLLKYNSLNMHHPLNNIENILDFSLALSYFPLHPFSHYILTLYLFNIVHILPHSVILTAYCLTSVFLFPTGLVKSDLIRPTWLLPQPSPCQLLGVYSNSSRSVVFKCWLFCFCFLFFSPVTKRILKNYLYSSHVFKLTSTLFMTILNSCKRCHF